jgi:hypothetical protein
MVINNTSNSYFSQADRKESPVMTDDKRQMDVKMQLDRSINTKESEKIEIQREINQLHIGRLLDILV